MSSKVEMLGKRFGHCIVTEEAESKIQQNGRKRLQYKCLCDCGNEFVALGENLRKGTTTSCGCYRNELLRKNRLKHGETDTRLYNVWCAMKRRCFNRNCPEYRLYGGRGITMCDEWKQNYSEFMQWAIDAGYDKDAPRGQCTIDRIDNNGSYCPENCRIVSQTEQMNNVSYNHYVEAFGQRHTISEWSKITGIPYNKLLRRINHSKMNAEEALR